MESSTSNENITSNRGRTLLRMILSRRLGENDSDTNNEDNNESSESSSHSSNIKI